jgi:hypothetical protein
MTTSTPSGRRYLVGELALVALAFGGFTPVVDPAPKTPKGSGTSPQN